MSGQARGNRAIPGAGVPGTAPSRLRALAVAGTAGVALAAVPAGAQQGGAAPPDTTPADTAEATADTAERVPPSYPVLAEGAPSEAVGQVYTWDRDELLDSSALTVADFVSDQVPGILPLRADVHFGPQHLADGLLGPGAVRVVVDGRELPRLESAQADLSRLALARVERLRVIRRAGEVVVSVTTPSHPGGEAYSRVTGGTGEPAADLIRGVFTNGAGQNFTVAAAVDHLDVGEEQGTQRRLDAWGKLSWMPFGNSSGVEVLWHSDAVERVTSREEDFTRRDVLIHGRADVAEGIQVDVWGGRTTRDPGPAAGEAPGPGSSRPSFEVPHADLGVTAARGPAVVEADVRVQDAEGLASLETDLRAGVRLVDGLSAHGAWHHGSWDDFTASRWSGGLSYRSGLLGGLVLRAEAATGTRGLDRPGRSADSLSFDALAGAAETTVGPYRLAGRATRRTVERQLPFGGAFDRALTPGPASTVVGLEGRARGPILPVAPLESRLRFEGFWRRNTAQSGTLPLYVPGDLARGEFRFQDSYFGGNLEVRAALRLLYRGTMLTARPGDPDPVALPARSTINTSVVIRIDTFRIWWRVDNLRRLEQRDFAGLPFPTVRNVFGVKWEFFN